MLNCLLVGLGGFLGSICRYLLGLLPLGTKGGFPIKTLLINVAGAFVIGLLAAAAQKTKAIDPRALLFLKVGVCGGFTTFSTFALETFDLLGSGAVGTALAYVLLSAALGVLAVYAAGLLIG